MSATPSHRALRTLSLQISVAAASYRLALRAQRAANDSWQTAMAEVTARYGDGSPEAVARALSAFNAAVMEAHLLDVSVDDEALNQMDKEARELEAVAQAARALADVLEADAAGGLQ